MAQADNRRPIHGAGTASRVFSGEAVVISPAENMVRMFNNVGSRIWELADGQRSVDEIVNVLVAEYEVERGYAADAVSRFVDDLLSRGLLELAA